MGLMDMNPGVFLAAGACLTLGAACMLFTALTIPYWSLGGTPGTTVVGLWKSCTSYGGGVTDTDATGAATCAKLDDNWGAFGEDCKGLVIAARALIIIALIFAGFIPMVTCVKLAKFNSSMVTLCLVLTAFLAFVCSLITFIMWILVEGNDGCIPTTANLNYNASFFLCVVACFVLLVATLLFALAWYIETKAPKEVVYADYPVAVDYPTYPAVAAPVTYAQPTYAPAATFAAPTTYSVPAAPVTYI